MTLGAIYIHGVAPVMLGGVELSGAPQRDGAEFYDVIVFFGMDWLSRHRVVLDCLKARVYIAGADEIFIACMLHTEELWNIRTKKFSATISMVKDDGQHELQDLPVIAEYEDIFVTFGTVTTRHMDALANCLEQTALVSRVYYHLSRAGMTELRKQLEKLFDKGFIRPSTSPWGALLLL